MDWKEMVLVFGSIFLAELGDKTQLAIFCFSTTQKSKLAVFLGASLALILTSLLAVALGALISRHLSGMKYIHWGAGVLFIIVGILILMGKFS